MDVSTLDNARLDAPAKIPFNGSPKPTIGVEIELQIELVVFGDGVENQRNAIAACPVSA